jgi:glycosyltransferase involved in cell wall biosynthesis
MPFGEVAWFSAYAWKHPHKIFKLFKFIEVAVRMVRAARRIRPDIIHANDLETLPIGCVLARLHRAKLVYDAHELWRDPGSRAGIPTWLFNLAVMTERWLAPKADGVITVSESIAEDMRDHLRIPLPTLVRNVPWPRTAQVQGPNHPGPLRRNLGLGPDTPILLYQGFMAEGYGVPFLLEALPSIPPPAVMVCLGFGPLQGPLAQRAEALGISDRVYFHPAVPPEVLISYTADATIGVCPSQGTCTSYDYSLPNKLFEYVQAGLPIAASNLAEIGRLVRRYNLGETFDHSNSQAIAGTLNRMLANPRFLEACREAAATAARELNWRQEERHLVELYQRLCPTSTRA